MPGVDKGRLVSEEKQPEEGEGEGFREGDGVL